MGCSGEGCGKIGGGREGGGKLPHWLTIDSWLVIHEVIRGHVICLACPNQSCHWGLPNLSPPSHTPAVITGKSVLYHSYQTSTNPDNKSANYMKKNKKDQSPMPAPSRLFRAGPSPLNLAVLDGGPGSPCRGHHRRRADQWPLRPASPQSRPIPPTAAICTLCTWAVCTEWEAAHLNTGLGVLRPI